MSDAVGCGNISGETLDLYKPPAARLAIAAQHFQVGVRTPCATGRILLTQLGSNSTIRLQKDGDSITVHITSNNFQDSVVFTLVEAHQLDLQSMPTVEYKPHV